MTITARYGTGVYGNSIYGLVFIGGIATLSFAGVTSALKGKTQLEGNTTFTFTGIAFPATTVLIYGSTQVSFDLVGTLKGTGSLSGLTDLTIDSLGELKGYTGLQSTTSFSVSLSGVLKGSTKLSGNTLFSLESTPTIKGYTQLEGLSTVDFSTSAILSVNPWGASSNNEYSSPFGTSTENSVFLYAETSGSTSLPYTITNN